MDLNFTKICRICLMEGSMMSIFKVNIFKKIMALTAVEVWQNDGLPTNICKKCSAKLHIAYQFKKQCEKSDMRLRQYMITSTTESSDNQERNSGVHNVNVQSLQQHIILPNNDCIYKDLNIVNRIQEGNEKFTSFAQIECNHHSLHYDEIQKSQMPMESYQFQNNLNLCNNSYALESVDHFSENVSAQLILPNSSDGLEPSIGLKQMSKIPSVSDNSVIEDSENCNKGKNQCTTCHKNFTSTQKLRRHMKYHSTNLRYICKVCKKSFSHGGNYKIHLRIHTGERPFVCSVCNFGCRQAQDLEKHMRTHTGERPHKCKHCSRAFSTSSNLVAHTRTHTGEKPYVCSVCEKSFCQSNELTKHMRTHTGEKPYICEVCHKGFNGSSTLIVHRRSHTGERPFSCELCRKSFSQSSSLAVHMKRHRTLTVNL